ncbi:hypothetical protein N7455_010053 [Penicillium solitum]|uniref:uncharacterized protein n=1 Tax=Penicillium solitum TaxID=60172 RepID=UPI0032C3F886|nr:hypothetical protein N7455_010053 [Penicillium solitum]
MTRIPDIVRDFELETRFLPGCSDTIHTYHESDLASGRRLVVRAEHWQREREIGSGTYGSIWLERCIEGGRSGVEVRAVKQLPTAYSDIDYHQPEAKVIAFQILEGLTMMHGNEFVHGDLKPNNILIKSHPPNMWWVKLSDFGLSKRVEEASGAPTLKGTPGPVFEVLGHLFEYATKVKDFPTQPLADVGTTDLSIQFIFLLMSASPKDRPSAEMAILHEYLRPMYDHLPSWQMSGSPRTSPQSPIKPMTEEFESEFGSEFGSWDTEPLLTLGEPLHQEPNDQPSTLSTESLGVAVPRQTISACGGVGKLCIAFSPDGKLIASCGNFAYMQLWDAVTLAEVGHTNLSDYPHTVVFSPDSRMIAYAINNKVVVQEVSGGSKRRIANCNFGFRDKDSPNYLSFSPDSKFAWFACLNKYQMLDIEQNLTGRIFKLPVLSKTIGLSIDGKYLAYLDNAKKAHICLLELSTKNVVLKIESGIHNPTGLAFSPNSKLLAVSLRQSFSRDNISL